MWRKHPKHYPGKLVEAKKASFCTGCRKRYEVGTRVIFLSDFMRICEPCSGHPISAHIKTVAKVLASISESDLDKNTERAAAEVESCDPHVIRPDESSGSAQTVPLIGKDVDCCADTWLTGEDQLICKAIDIVANSLGRLPAEVV